MHIFSQLMRATSQFVGPALIGAFELNNLNDMTIYTKIREQDYRTVFENYCSELSMQEIISKFNTNN